MPQLLEEIEFYDDDLEKMILPHIAESIKASASFTHPGVLEWAEHYLPHYLTCEPSAFHKTLAKEFKRLVKTRGERIALIGPRDSGKSVWCSTINPLYSICEGTEEYIQLFADVLDQARLYLEAVKKELETNTEIAEDYPHVFGEGPKWSMDQIVTRNGIRVEALGTGKKIRGRRERQSRPTLIVVDDPENEEHIYSALKRERSSSWFWKALEKSGGPKTNIIVPGTAIHRQCLVKCLAKAPGFKGYEFKSIVKWPTRMDLWEAWKDIFTDMEKSSDARRKTARTFYMKNRKQMDRGAVVLWPERESLYDLMLMWAVDKISFLSEKQNEPVDPSKNEFPPDYFDYGNFWFDRWPDYRKCTIVSWDPSKGKDSKTGDYSAVCILCIGEEDVLYADFELRRIPPETMAQIFVDHGVTNDADALVLEINQFQELLEPVIFGIADVQNLTLNLRTIENTVNKGMRIRRIGPYLSQRKIRFKRSEGSRLCIEQLKDFRVGGGEGSHDDGPDALEMAIRIGLEYIGGEPASELDTSETWP